LEIATELGADDWRQAAQVGHAEISYNRQGTISSGLQAAKPANTRSANPNRNIPGTESSYSG
jgi:hypothetical protein